MCIQSVSRANNFKFRVSTAAPRFSLTEYPHIIYRCELLVPYKFYNFKVSRRLDLQTQIALILQTLPLKAMHFEALY